MATEDDDELALSLATQKALAEFLAEKEAKESELQSPTSHEPLSIESFAEDWQVLLVFLNSSLTVK
jgi:hypothetical protein